MWPRRGYHQGGHLFQPGGGAVWPEVLARGVNYNSNNTTRFVVVSPVMELREGADKISAVLSLPDEVGSLHEVLTIFAVHGLNLVKLESRPLPGRSWEYLFFLEFDGSLADPAMDGALQELSQASAEMRSWETSKATCKEERRWTGLCLSPELPGASGRRWPAALPGRAGVWG